jgi:hypothetical protein
MVASATFFVGTLLQSAAAYSPAGPAQFLRSSPARSGWTTTELRARSAPVRCQSEIPEEAMQSIPPAAMADAWMRDEKARELGEALKGCSVYVIGASGSKLEGIGRIFSRRLPKYRFYSVPDLMCSTYNALSGGAAGSTPPKLSEMYASAPLSDVKMLSRGIMDQVQQYTRSVVNVWEGAVTTSDFAVMQQGIVVRVAGPQPDDPGAGGEALAAARSEWQGKYVAADLTVDVAADAPSDDIVFGIMERLLEFIRTNPGKSDEWKTKSEALLKQGWTMDNPPTP